MFELKIKQDNIISDLKIKPENYWPEVKEREILKLFHSASKKVPAYKDFLQKNKIIPEKIKSLEDFKLVPAINKENYLHFYPYKKLFWDGSVNKPATIHSTSGSTGESTFFERDLDSDLRREVIIENFFRANKLTLKGPTLFVITFGMGVWSAGMGIYTAAYLTTNKNKLPISIVSPGVNKIEVLKILKKLSPNYNQTIIAGYPPFVKDIIDNAQEEKIDTQKINLRFVFTGEAFTEEFRDYILSKAKIQNIFLDTMNTYGTSEFGATAVETPLTIMARRLAYKNKNIFQELFGNITKTPTLAQYIPNFVNFECVNGELFLTGDGPIPLIKYQSGDNGGILTYTQIKSALLKNGVDLEKESKKLGIAEQIYKLPTVFVYERKNLTASLYGILIYPEFIKIALFDKQLSKFLTGKFTMCTKFNKNQKQYLEINLELKKNINLKKDYQKISLEKIVEVLKEKSSEYRELSQNMKNKVHPKLIFWPYEYPKYFSSNIKQKWVINKK